MDVTKCTVHTIFICYMHYRYMLYALLLCVICTVKKKRQCSSRIYTEHILRDIVTVCFLYFFSPSYSDEDLHFNHGSVELQRNLFYHNKTSDDPQNVFASSFLSEVPELIFPVVQSSSGHKSTRHNVRCVHYNIVESPRIDSIPLWHTRQ